MSNLVDPADECRSLELAQVWLAKVPLDLGQAVPRSAAVVAAAGGGQAVGAMAQAYRLASLATHSEVFFDRERRLQVEAECKALDDQPCERARWVAEAVAAYLGRLGDDPPLQPWLKRLALHGGAVDSRPVPERLLTETARVMLLTLDRDYAGALRAILRAQTLPLPDELADLRRRFVFSPLAYILLTTGDLEGAKALLPRLVDWGVREGAEPHGAVYNLLLACAAEGDVDTASGVLQAQPWFSQLGFALGPAYSSVRAWVLAGRGDTDGARRLLDASPPAHLEDRPAMLANDAWLRGATWLALGDGARARLACEHFIARQGGGDEGLSPLNGTQLHRVLSLACEAVGDHAASLRALRASQAHCCRWVGESLQVRLATLHGLSDDPDLLRRQQRRIDEVRQAAVKAAAEVASNPSAAAVRPAGGPNLVAVVAHELRNPIGALMGTTSLLLLDQLSSQQRHLLELANSSARMLLNLCNDLLDLASADAGHLKLNPAPTDVGAILKDTVALFVPLAQVHGVTLSADVHAALPAHLPIDSLRLQQVLMNLLNNALKFSPRGVVQLTARCLQAGTPTPQLRVEVRDSGPGLSEDARRRLFLEFSQVHDTSAAGAPRGTGLGLALCRRLVGLMGGRIGADSEPGRGSTFWFELPMATATGSACS